MKATLYEALGIPQLASDEDVRAALRRLIRKYYAKTRDGQGNVEEALRFINHASRILSDRGHRLHYDKELSVTTEANTEQRIAHFVSNVAAPLGGIATGDDVIDLDEKALTVPLNSPGKHPHHPGLTERVASIGTQLKVIRIGANKGCPTQNALRSLITPAPCSAESRSASTSPQIE